MRKSKGGLGRGILTGGKGIGAIISDEVPSGASVMLPVDEIRANEFQPRKSFDENALSELKASIEAYGVLQPIVVRKVAGGYELAAGERRFRAAKLAGLTEIPAIVKKYDDKEMSEIALIENLQREDLNIMEEAAAYRNLMADFGLTQEELAQRMGRSRSYIANVLRLLALEPTVQELVSRGTLTMGQVRPLVIITDEELQMKLAYHIAENGLSARASEELVKRVLEPKEQPVKARPKKEIFLTEAEDRLMSALGTQVTIRPGKKKSKIEIEFYSEDELERLLEYLTAERKARTAKHEFHV